MAKEDLRFHRGFFDNIKIKRFKSEFKGQGCPLCALMKIWIYAAMHKSEGTFEAGYELDDFELMADWQGSPGLFGKMLVKHRLIVETPDGYAINDWEEHQPWVAKSRQRSAAGKANAGERWSKKNANLKIGNADSKIGNAKNEKADANLKIGNAPNPIPIPIPKPKPKPKPSPEPDSDDYPRDIVKWFNEIVAPPFSPVRAFTKNVRWQIMKALEILREIHGPDAVDGNEVLIFRQYLLRAKEQYEHGQVPCKWGISNLCKEDNITKIIDGVFAPKEGAEEWAKEAKERLT